MTMTINGTRGSIQPIPENELAQYRSEATVQNGATHAIATVSTPMEVGIQRRLRSKIRKQMDRDQKEYYLNEKIKAIQEREPPRLRRLRKDLGADLESVLATALEKEVEGRYSSASSFVDDLGADSLDTVELVMALEEEFECEIPDEEAEKITTVQQAIDYVKSTVDK